MSLEWSPARTGDVVVDRDFEAVAIRLREAEKRLRALEALVPLSGVVRPTAACQQMVIPVTKGDGLGKINAWGWVVGDALATDRTMTVYINGAATSSMLAHACDGAAGGVSVVGSVFTYSGNGCLFTLEAITRRGAQRAGIFKAYELRYPTIYESAFEFSDADDLITSIALRSSSTTGIAVGSFVAYEERAIP